MTSLEEVLSRLSSTFDGGPAEAMRAAIEQLCGIPTGKVPTCRQLGNKLRVFSRNVIGGRYLDGRRTKDGTAWILYHTRKGVFGVSGESISDPYEKKVGYKDDNSDGDSDNEKTIKAPPNMHQSPQIHQPLQPEETIVKLPELDIDTWGLNIV